MHKSTKITPVLRKEIFTRWKKANVSQRQLALEYHVDKRVVGRIVERGSKGDFEIHSSVNKRFLKTSPASVRTTIKKTRPKKTARPGKGSAKQR